MVSGFIAVESLRRLIDGGGHEVETTWWAFAVLGVVIGLDAWRAVASRRAARRHRSAAFAANALHFGSDLAGSVAVLIGLILVAAGEPSADAAAALFVAALVVIAAVRLARPVGRRPHGPGRGGRGGAHPPGARRAWPSPSSCAARACATPPGATLPTSSWRCWSMPA